MRAEFRAHVKFLAVLLVQVAWASPNYCFRNGLNGLSASYKEQGQAIADHLFVLPNKSRDKRAVIADHLFVLSHRVALLGSDQVDPTMGCVRANLCALCLVQSAYFMYVCGRTVINPHPMHSLEHASCARLDHLLSHP
jgi:hypothetical protein